MGILTYVAGVLCRHIIGRQPVDSLISVQCYVLFQCNYHSSSIDAVLISIMIGLSLPADSVCMEDLKVIMIHCVWLLFMKLIVFCLEPFLIS